MPKSFEFFFDYVSPTSFIAHHMIPGVVERTGAGVIYRPLFQGGVMHATGNKPPGTVPAKAKYLSRDLQRCAKRAGVALYSNPHFPMNTLNMTRATLGLTDDPETRARFIDTCFRYCYGLPKPIDPSNEDELATMCEAEGFDTDVILALAKDPANKDRLRANTEEAVERGVFGTPAFFVGDELFFGQDRLDYVEEALNA